MFRFRKTWIFVAIVVVVVVLITSFFQPDFVTVVPNRHQLDQRESDLHLQHESDADDGKVSPEHPEPGDSLIDSSKIHTP